jgi:hypothetical protein
VSEDLIYGEVPIEVRVPIVIDWVKVDCSICSKQLPLRLAGTWQLVKFLRWKTGAITITATRLQQAASSWTLAKYDALQVSARIDRPVPAVHPGSQGDNESDCGQDGITPVTVEMIHPKCDVSAKGLSTSRIRYLECTAKALPSAESSD